MAWRTTVGLYRAVRVFTSDLWGALGLCSLSFLRQTSNGPGLYLDTVCEVNFFFSGSMYYCALTCGSFVQKCCSAVWRFGAGGFSRGARSCAC